MVEFSRDDKRLRVAISSGILNNRYILYWNCEDECYAELLRERLSKKMAEELQRIRREAYNDGWKDAKAKVKKKDWFGGWW